MSALILQRKKTGVAIALVSAMLAVALGFTSNNPNSRPFNVDARSSFASRAYDSDTDSFRRLKYKIDATHKWSGGHLPFVRCYLDDVLIITKGSWEEHCESLATVLKILLETGLKVNAIKSFFGRIELEYLGFIVNTKGIRPVPNKVEAIKAILPPTNRKQLRRFIGMLNFQKEMWPGRSKMLVPLTRLTSKNVPFNWTDVEQKAFDDIKKHITKDTLLNYPNFNKPFDVYTDASDKQIGAIISQDGKPIAHFSRTLNSAQKNYTVTDKETLSIVEVLKEYRSILYNSQTFATCPSSTPSCWSRGNGSKSASRSSRSLALTTAFEVGTQGWSCQDE